MIKHVSGKELEELLASSDKTVFCDFWAAWCGPCRMLAPVYEELAEKYGDKAVFVKMDIDENEEAAVKHGIMSIPNVLAFKNGAKADNSLGFVPPAMLDAFIQKNM